MLPPPQESVGVETANADWPNTPEQRRARLRADATAHQDDPSYQSQIVDDVQTDPASVKEVEAMAESGSSHPGGGPAWKPGFGQGSQKSTTKIKRRLAERQAG